MNISSRSTRYNYQPLSLEVKESEICDRRQHRTELVYARHLPVPQPLPASMNLGHRAVSRTAEDLPVCQHQEQVLHETAKKHINNIQNNLERRLAAAQARGDRNLIRLLESEFKQIELYAS